MDVYLNGRIKDVIGLYHQLSSRLHSVCSIFQEESKILGQMFLSDMEHDLKDVKHLHVKILEKNENMLVVSIPGRILAKPRMPKSLKNDYDVELSYFLNKNHLIIRTIFLKDEVSDKETRIHLKIIDIGMKFSDGEFMSAKCYAN